MNRRRRVCPWRIAAGLIAVALIASACGASTPTTAAPSPTEVSPTTANPQSTATSAPTAGPLVVLEWSGYELPEFWQPFADKYPDVLVDYSFFAEDAEAYAKMQTGFQTDVVHPCSSWWTLYVDAGLVLPIDTSRLKNWSGLIEPLVKEGHIDGKQYFVPWDWGYESILVRTDKVSVVPDSWADLWDPQYAGHVALWDSGESNHAMTALALGLAPMATTPEQDVQIKQKLIEIKPNLVTYWADYTEAVQLALSGDAWLIANAWPDAYKLAIDEGANPDTLAYIEPKEGRLGWLCGYGISSNAKNVDLAYAYLDALIAPESMAALANEYAYGAANAEALPLTDPDFVALMQLDQPDILERTVFLGSLTAEQQKNFTSMWADVKAAP